MRSYTVLLFQYSKRTNHINVNKVPNVETPVWKSPRHDHPSVTNTQAVSNQAAKGGGGLCGMKQTASVHPGLYPPSQRPLRVSQSQFNEFYVHTHVLSKRARSSVSVDD